MRISFRQKFLRICTPSSESRRYLPLKNNSKTDTYTIEIRRDSDGSLIADPITLAAGASVSSITLKDVPEYGNAACTATITATRDGKTVGTLEVKTALHAAYLWPKEVMSK